MNYLLNVVFYIIDRQTPHNAADEYIIRYPYIKVNVSKYNIYCNFKKYPLSLLPLKHQVMNKRQQQCH